MSLFLAPIHPHACREQDPDQYFEWLKTDHPREVIEAAQAHVVRNRSTFCLPLLRRIRWPSPNIWLKSQ